MDLNFRETHPSWYHALSRVYPALPGSLYQREPIPIRGHSIITAIFTLGSHGIRTFRALWERFSRTPSRDTDLNGEIQRLSKETLLIQPSQTSESLSENSRANFVLLKDYIRENYPYFPIADYSSIASLQAEGHPFHFAVSQMDWELFNLLLLAGGDVNQVDESGDHALLLHLSTGYRTLLDEMKKEEAIECYFEQLHFLIQGKSDLLLKNKMGNSALETLFIQQCLDQDILFELVQKNINTANASHFSAILFATEDERVLDYFNQLGVPTDCIDPNGRTPLFVAVRDGKAQKVQILLKRGANPHQRVPVPAAHSPTRQTTPLEMAKDTALGLLTQALGLRERGIDLDEQLTVIVESKRLSAQERAKLDKRIARLRASKKNLTTYMSEVYAKTTTAKEILDLLLNQR